MMVSFAFCCDNSSNFPSFPVVDRGLVSLCESVSVVTLHLLSLHLCLTSDLALITLVKLSYPHCLTHTTLPTLLYPHYPVNTTLPTVCYQFTVATLLYQTSFSPYTPSYQHCHARATLSTLPFPLTLTHTPLYPHSPTNTTLPTPSC